MGAGAAVEGFASVAFPIVRRVFGGLLANDLVSVQPMSLPSGLIFFLDFTRNATSVADTTPASPYDNDQSLHGGGAVASGIANGVELDGASTDSGFYNLQTGYSNGRGVATIAATKWVTTVATVKLTATGADGLLSKSGGVYTAKALAMQKAIQYDKVIMDVAASESLPTVDIAVVKVSNLQTASTFSSGDMTQFAQG